jgi:FKBP-type peptidyl-prolyl cis-trans isomerase
MQQTIFRIIAATACCGFFVTACSNDMGGDAATNDNTANPASVDSASGLNSILERVRTLDDGSEFVIRTMQAGDAAAGTAEPGQLVSVHYTGWLYDPAAATERGAQFDSSVGRGAPFQFPLGAGRVIRGWDQGVEGMTIGEKRELIIPALWAYGERGAGGVIPPGATLLFEVELLGLN